jgi:acyl-CoA thioesterase FadM
MTQDISPKPLYRSSSLIPFHLTDAAGILFFSHAFTLAHQAFEQFIVHHVDSSWQNWFQNPEWIVPIKQAEAQYYHPLYAGKNCHVDLTVQNVSTCSFTLVSNLIQDHLCCKVSSVHVFCDRLTLQKRAIPEEIKKLFQ